MQSPEEQARRPYPPRWYKNWRTILYLIIGIALCLWGSMEIAADWETLPGFILLLALGIAFLIVAYRQIHSDREAKPR